MKHYWPINDGPPCNGNFGRVADVVSPLGWAQGITNVHQTSWKWDARFGTNMLFVATPTTRFVVNNSTSHNYTNWSISAWVNPKTITANITILNHGTGASINRFMDVESASSGKVRVAFTTGGAAKITSTAVTIPTGKWAHVVGTFDGTNLTIYLNGKQSGTNVFAFVADSPANDTTLGAIDSGGTASFDGQMAHIAEWNRALKPEEVALLFLYPTILQPRYGLATAGPPLGPPQSLPNFVGAIVYGGKATEPGNQPGGLLPMGAIDFLNSLAHG